MLGWVNTDVYQVKELSVVINNIAENTCSAPILTDFGYHLLWLEKIRPGGQPNLKDHWPKIEAISLNNKKMVWYENWIKKERANFYVEIIN